MNKTNKQLPFKATRKPIKDIKGDEDSLGILLMDAEVLNKCRLLSGEGEEYKHEYAVWYSSHDMYMNIGKHRLTVSRPYSFYNINQVTGGNSVEYEADDRKMLNEIDKELKEEYQSTIVKSKEVTDYNNKVVDIIKRYYTISHFNNDISKFRVMALAELHVDIIYKDVIGAFSNEARSITVDTLKKQESELEVGSDDYLAFKELHTDEEINYMIDDMAYNLAIKKLLDNEYEIDESVSEEDIYEASLTLATQSLEDNGYIILGTLGDMSEKEQKDIIDNNKLVIGWYLSNFHTFHAHPEGFNEFSGTIGGTSGDLMNKYEETFNRSTREWEQAYNSEIGIVYQFVADENTNPIPSYSGVVQQINRATTLVFNELRLWKCVKGGDYTYSRTPSLTFVKGFAPELEETVLPTLSKMLGKSVPKPLSHDYVIPFMGASTSSMTEEIFEAYLDTPFKVLYDVDSARISQSTVGIYNRYVYGHNTTTHNKKYPKKKDAIKWVMKHITKVKNSLVTKKSLGRLNSKNLESKMDDVAVSTLYEKDNKTTRDAVEKMNKVFSMFGINFFDFIDEYQKNYNYSVNIVEYFVNPSCPNLYQWSVLQKKGKKLDSIIGLSSSEISNLVIAAPTSHKNNWPLNDRDIINECIAAGINVTSSISSQVALYKFKEYIFDMYNVPKEDRYRLWNNLEMLDFDVLDLTDIMLLQANQYTIEAILEWNVPKATTDSLIKSGLTSNDLIWLTYSQQEKLLIEKRRENKVNFTKLYNTSTSFANYLTKTHDIRTIKVGYSSYGLHAMLAKDEVSKLFNTLYQTDLVKHTKRDVQGVINILDRLSIDKASLLELEDVGSTIDKLLSINNNDLLIIEKYIAPYTDSCTILIEYTSKELSKLVSPSNSIHTTESLGIEILESHSYSIDILTNYDVHYYVTTIGNNEVKVSINTTNCTKALTNLVLEKTCTELSKENARSVISNINLIDVDILELLEMNKKEQDVYINMLVDFNLDYGEVSMLIDNKIDWKDILCTTPTITKVNHTRVPYKSNGVYVKEIDDELIVIPQTEFTELCKELCVITEVKIIKGKHIAYLSGGHSIKLREDSTKGIGDIVYPTSS